MRVWVLLGVLAVLGCRKPHPVGPDAKPPAKRATQGSRNAPPVLLAGDADPLPGEGELTFEDLDPILLVAPPSRQTLRRKGPGGGSAPRLKLASKARNKITDVDAWFERNRLRRPNWRIGGAKADLPAGIPLSLKFGTLRGTFRHDDHTILKYGSVLVVADADLKPVAAYDVRAYELISGQRADTRWAAMHEDTLYFSHAHRTYASTTGGLNAFVTAIDAKTGEMLWRTRPLVNNSDSFAVTGGFIIAGYGFTREQDRLYIVSRADGKVVGQTKINSGPDHIILHEGKLFVRTYDTDYVFTAR